MFRIHAAFHLFLAFLCVLVGEISSAWAAPSLPDGRWTPHGYEIRVVRGMTADVVVGLFSRWYAQSAQAQGFSGETLDVRVLQAANVPESTRMSCVRAGRVERVSREAWLAAGCRRYLGLLEGSWLLVPSRPPGREASPTAALPTAASAASVAPPVVPADSAVIAAACLREEACRSRVAAMGLLAISDPGETYPPPASGTDSVSASVPPYVSALLLFFVASAAMAAYVGARRGAKVFAQRLVDEMQWRLDAALASAAVATGQAKAAHESARAAYMAAEEIRQYALSLEGRLDACLGVGVECLQFLGLDPERFPGDKAWAALPRELAAKASAMTERVNGSLEGLSLSLGGQLWFDRPLRAISLLAAELRQRDIRIAALEGTRAQLLEAVRDAADAAVCMWDEARSYAERLGVAPPSRPDVVDRLAGCGFYDVDATLVDPSAAMVL